MPHAPYWWRNVGQVIEKLEQLPDRPLDRSAVSRLFQLSGRQATRIMHAAGAVRTGGALLISREQLAVWLESLSLRPEFRQEHNRLSALRQKMASARRQVSGSKIRIPDPDPGYVFVHSLPDTIRLSKGRLEIRFSSLEDLLRQLRLLGLAMTDDWERIKAAVE